MPAMTIRIDRGGAGRSTRVELANHHLFLDFRRRALAGLAMGRGEPVAEVA